MPQPPADQLIVMMDAGNWVIGGGYFPPGGYSRFGECFPCVNGIPSRALQNDPSKSV